MPEQRLSDSISVRVTALERSAIEQLARDERRSIGFLARDAIRLLFEDRGVDASHAVA